MKYVHTTCKYIAAISLLSSLPRDPCPLIQTQELYARSRLPSCADVEHAWMFHCDHIWIHLNTKPECWTKVFLVCIPSWALHMVCTASLSDVLPWNHLAAGMMLVSDHNCHFSQNYLQGPISCTFWVCLAVPPRLPHSLQMHELVRTSLFW